MAVNEYKAGNLDEAQVLLIELLDSDYTAIGTKLTTYNWLGTMLSESGDSEGALKSYESILANTQASDLIKGRALHNKAVLFFQEGDYSLALHYYLEALSFIAASQDSDALFITLLDLGETYLELGDTDEALNSLTKALTLGIKLQSAPEEYRIYQLLARAFIDNQPRKAIQHLKTYDSINSAYLKNRDELALESKRLRLVEAVASYYRLKEQAQTLDARARANTRNILWISLVSIFSIALLVLWLRAFDKQRRKRFYQALLKTGDD